MLTLLLASILTVAPPNEYGYAGSRGCLISPEAAQAMSLPTGMAGLYMMGEFKRWGQQVSTVRGTLSGWTLTNDRPFSEIPDYNPPELRLYDEAFVNGGLGWVTTEGGAWELKALAGGGEVWSPLWGTDLALFDLRWTTDAQMDKYCESMYWPTKYSGMSMADICWVPSIVSSEWRDGVDVQLQWGDPLSEYDVSVGNACWYLTDIQNWVVDELPEGWKKPRVHCLVNSAMSFTCNAMVLIGHPVTYFAASSEDCLNAAFGSVLVHEYGHIVLDTLHPYYDFQPEVLKLLDIHGFHEGSADALAALYFDSPCMGLDFFGEYSGCARDLMDPYRVFPVESPDPHTRGIPLAGGFWELQQLVGCDVAKRLFLAWAERTETYMSLDTGLVGELLDIDGEMYGGVHVAEILMVFHVGRGFPL